MINYQIIAEVEVPHFKNTYTLLKKTKPRYYLAGDRIPADIKAQVKTVKDGYLINGLGQKILKNAKQINKLPTKPINSQNLYNGTMHFMERARIMREMKEQFAIYIKQLPVITEFPIHIHYEFHCEWGSRDLSNLSFIFIKGWEDAMVAARVIPDDQLKFISSFSTAGVKELDENRKLVVKIAKILP